jgi:hypothetical protein
VVFPLLFAVSHGAPLGSIAGNHRAVYRVISGFLGMTVLVDLAQISARFESTRRLAHSAPTSLTRIRSPR